MHPTDINAYMAMLGEEADSSMAIDPPDRTTDRHNGREMAQDTSGMPRESDSITEMENLFFTAITSSGAPAVGEGQTQHDAAVDSLDHMAKVFFGMVGSSEQEEHAWSGVLTDMPASVPEAAEDDRVDEMSNLFFGALACPGEQDDTGMDSLAEVHTKDGRNMAPEGEPNPRAMEVVEAIHQPRNVEQRYDADAAGKGKGRSAVCGSSQGDNMDITQAEEPSRDLEEGMDASKRIDNTEHTSDGVGSPSSATRQGNSGGSRLPPYASLISNLTKTHPASLGMHVSQEIMASEVMRLQNEAEMFKNLLQGHEDLLENLEVAKERYLQLWECFE